MLCELLIFEASLNTTYTAMYKAVLQDGSTSFSIQMCTVLKTQLQSLYRMAYLATTKYHHDYYHL